MLPPAPDPTAVDGAPAHRVTLALVEPFPAEVEAGTAVAARVSAACAAGCDLAGAHVRVLVSGKVHAEATLENGEASLRLEAPPRVGDWTCTFVLGESPDEHSTTLGVTSRVIPHRTTLAVWTAESPTRGRSFAVSVGVKCSAGCSLGGHTVEVLDENGVSVAKAKLGATPAPGTSALYAADVPLVAPDRPGVHARSVRFAGKGLALPHEGADASFTFRCLEPAEHTVTVRVVLEGIEARRQGVEVRVGRYTSSTDESGVAKVGVPKGVHEVTFWRVDLEPTSTRVDVAGDLAVELIAGPRKVVDHDAERWG
jgi:hypothetical protein